MSGPDAELVCERQGALSLLRLNRPEARNSLTTGLVDALGAAVLEAEAEPGVRAIVLTGTGDRAFCSGMDLKSFSEGDVPGATPGETTEAFYRLLRGEVSVPVVGAANGSAVAGGLELLLGCDVVIASSEARFGLPEVKRGLFAAGGGTLIGNRIPTAIALELTLTGDLVDAARAYQIGLVNAVVAPGEVWATAVAMAERIAANGPLGLAASKELVRLSASDPAAARERQAEWSSVVFASEDAMEGARAYMEKRDPVWRGR
ncbi:MAG: enoyl-CoA hydratase-related protein [Acidimicrobiales bacterium]|jgi:enoyl-CoA hydratase/carnithine racemase